MKKYKNRKNVPLDFINEDKINYVYEYFEEMSYEEAGKIIGKTVSQISSLVYRAKASLKNKLGDEVFNNV